MDDKRRGELLKIVEKSYKKLDAPVQHRLVVAFDALVFNLTAFLCLIAIINDRKKIATEDVDQLKEYVDSKCTARAAWLARQAPQAPQAGGNPTPFPSEYFGPLSPSPRTAMAPSGSPAGVNFGAAIARGAISGGAAAKPKKILAGNKDVANMVASIVKLHEMEITKTDIAKIQGFFDVYINCFIGTIAPADLTVEFINKELRKPFHIMFQ